MICACDNANADIFLWYTEPGALLLRREEEQRWCMLWQQSTKQKA